jgi:hypothetical protein
MTLPHGLVRISGRKIPQRHNLFDGQKVEQFLFRAIKKNDR